MQIVRNEKGEAARITMPRWFDAHLHVRHGEMLKLVLPFTAAYCDCATIMPNRKRDKWDFGILSGRDVAGYRAEILSALDRHIYFRHPFAPIMTVKITDETTPEMVEDAWKEGALAGKGYPLGVTTNTEKGITDFRQLWPVFGKMEELGMLLLLHGTVPRKPGAKITEEGERELEWAFIPTLLEIHRAFPRLKIVLEHVTTKRAVNLISTLPETVRATITAHHPLLTLDQVLEGGKIKNVHNYCEPVAKGERDREALEEALVSGDPHYLFGTDSAPHPELEKLWTDEKQGKPGTFTAPIAYSLRIELFEKHGCLEKLEPHTSGSGMEHYGLEHSERTVTFVKKPWVVPDRYGDVVPFKAGETLQWQIEETINAGG